MAMDSVDDDDNLWGQLESNPPTQSPADILKRQGAILEERTGGRVAGIVTTNENADGFVTYFSVCSAKNPIHPRRILTASYSLTLYPVRVNNLISKEQHDATSEDEYRKVLKKVLGSSDVHHLINVIRNATIG